MRATSSKEWVAANDSRALKSFGITASKSQVTRAIEVLRENILFNAELHGKNIKTAHARIASSFKCERNSNGDDIWKIHRSELGYVRDWIEQEKDWVSINNDARLRSLGITSRETVLDFVIATIARGYTLPMVQDGTSNKAIKYSLECRGIRQIKTKDGNLLWQFNEKKVVDEVKQALNEHIHNRDNPQWINSHNQSGFRQLGLNLTPSALDDTINRYYHTSIASLVGLGKSHEVATEMVERYIRPATTDGAKASWEIRRDYIPRFMQHVESQLVRHEPEWFSPTSKRWTALGLRAAGSTIEQAMQILETQEIALRVGSDMTHEEAQREVHSTIVKPAFGKSGKEVMKATLEQAEKLRAIIDQMPHRHHAIERANTRIAH